MDIPQPKQPVSSTRRNLVLLVGLLLITVVAWKVVSGSPETIVVNTRDLVIEVVTQGEFIRDIRAPGTLQPQTYRWIAATSRVRVEQILIHPGAKVQADTIIMRLSNPALTREFESATYALDVAEAELKALRKKLESDVLAQEAVVNDYQARFENANFRLEANEALSHLQIVSALDVKENKLLQQQYQSRLVIEKKRLEHLKELHVAELNAKGAQVNQTRSGLMLQQSLVKDLSVTAGLKGVLQQVPVEQGQQISTGEILARVAQEDDLKAELRVQESLIKDVLIGQQVVISAGGNKAKGTVNRIDPAVQNGVVVVDVVLEDIRLTGARPDLRISGLIEIERLQNVLTVRRPVRSQEHSENKLYVLNEEGDQANLNPVSFGSGSIDKILVTSGLQVGSRVIVSDTSQFNQQPILSLQ